MLVYCLNSSQHLLFASTIYGVLYFLPTEVVRSTDMLLMYFFFLHKWNSNCILLVNEVISKYKVHVGSGIFEAEKTRCKIRILEDGIKDEFPK